MKGEREQYFIQGDIICGFCLPGSSSYVTRFFVEFDSEFETKEEAFWKGYREAKLAHLGKFHSN